MTPIEQLDEVIGLMAEDKSNDWSDEIETLESLKVDFALQDARIVALERRIQVITSG